MHTVERIILSSANDHPEDQITNFVYVSLLCFCCPFQNPYENEVAFVIVLSGGIFMM